MNDYEPYPLWSCEHQWIVAGPPVKMWQSTGTQDTPPEDCFCIQKVKCIKCGGIQYSQRKELRNEIIPTN